MKYKTVYVFLLIVATMLVVLGIHYPAVSQTSTRTPSPSTTNLDPLDIRSATLYQSEDFVIQFNLPAGWQRLNDVTPGFYLFQYNALGGRSMRLLILVGRLQAIYKRLASLDFPVNSPQELLEKLKERYKPVVESFGDVQPVRVGKWDGYRVEGQGQIWDQAYDTLFDDRVAMLSDGMALFVSLSAGHISWQRAETLFDDILNSLVVNSPLLPVTQPDLFTLQLTATALQTQIDSLMATKTVSPTPTVVSK